MVMGSTAALAVTLGHFLVGAGLVVSMLNLKSKPPHKSGSGFLLYMLP